ncbi:fungal specific transcription factor domain-containing protein [Aspergillus affinis]|uniref:fungal specific transcription factor domain-containing protein n=1 Tax=Aspergillus affinis TaxID=1070780 RepID=UPI0022FE4A32|nr:uncharacterized protein KD926_002982 [Aspergillus affinis]KAI9035701.1 hypothetical protein KD926_002982 [Aspergillus affinis]
MSLSLSDVRLQPRHRPVSSTGWTNASLLPTAIPIGEPSLCGQARRLLESTGLCLDEISVRYFRGIHAFVPVVSRRQFQARLLSFGADPQVDVALLLLCMALLTSADSPETGGRRVGDQTPYLAIKSLVAQTQALCAPTTRLVQVGVLLAVYEYASGHPETAFITIGSSARMAYAARLRPSPSLNGPVPLTDWIAEEEINIWGFIRADKRRTFLCELPAVEQPLGSVMPARDDRLPLESDILDHENAVAALAWSVAIHAVSVPEVGGFGRAAQAAWLLDGALQGLSLTDPDRKRTHLAD